MISTRWGLTAGREATTRTATSPAGKQPRAQGFTLIELLVVLAILSVMVILAVPLLNRFSPGLELKSTAHTVAAAMREARALAIRDNGEVAVLIDLDNHLVSVGQGRNAAVINPRVGISLYTAAEELEGAGAGRIRFFADGTSTGGRVRLSLDGRQFDVTVNWITGGVTIDD